MSLSSSFRKFTRVALVFGLVGGMLALSVGCHSEGRSAEEWSFEEDAGSTDVGNEVAVDREVDSGGFPDVTCSGLPQVKTTILSGEVKLIGHAHNAPMISGGRVYFEQRVDDDLHVFSHVIGGAKRQKLTDKGFDVSLQAVDDGRVVTMRRQEVPSTAYLQIRDETGTVLDEIVNSVLGVFSTELSGGPMFSFDGERFLTESGLHVLIFGIDGQALFDGDFKNEAYPVHAVLSPDGFTFTGLPDVEEHAEVSSYQPPAEVFQWTSKSGRRQLTRTSEHERGVWSTGDDLYWVTADAVYRRAGDGPVDKIYQGRCGPPHALGGKAVFACNAPEQVHQTFSDLDEEISDIRANDFLARQPLPKRIVLHDDSGTRPLRLNGDEGLIHSVRISHSGIAWFEFDEPDALCGASEMGRVMYRDFATSETVQIGEVQAPCYCCDHTPVPLRLDIADGVVAWNYAQPWKVKQGESESNRSAYTSGFAYATIEPPEECN